MSKNDVHIFIHSAATRDTLQSGKSPEVFSHNVKTEVAAGKPQKQALAIAYSKQRGGKDSDIEERLKRLRERRSGGETEDKKGVNK